MFAIGVVLENYKEVMGDEFDEFLADMLDTFLQVAPGLFADLKRAISTNDPQLFMFAAHKLKSNVKTFGAQEVAQIAGQMEDMGNQGTLSGAHDILTACEMEYKELSSDLQDLRKSLSI